MENLNAEAIKTALKCCDGTLAGCKECPNYNNRHRCKIEADALALITSQEQRIEELETESERLKARTVEVLAEFAESVKRYYSALPGATVGAAVRFYVDEKLKEALDKI